MSDIGLALMILGSLLLVGWVVWVLVITAPNVAARKYPKNVADWYPDSEWCRVTDLKSEPIEVWKHVDGRATDYRLTAAGDGPNGPA